MSSVKIRLAKDKKELEKVFRIRQTVFIKGQNVPANIERDEFDMGAKHFILLYKSKAIGCARIRFVKEKAKLERIAILKEYRGKGFGKILVDYLVRYCKGRKIKIIFMNAQYYLNDYYQKLGFNPRGRIFSEAGIKHIKMYYSD